MNGKTVIQVTLGRLLLPISLLAASVLRQNVLSMIYFILLLVSPFIRRNTKVFDGPFRGYIIIVLAYSCLAVLSQIVFQLYLALYAAINKQHYGDVLGTGEDSCSLVDTLQWIGFERLDAPSSEAYQVVRLVLPDIVVLLLSIITFAVLNKLLHADDLLNTQESSVKTTRSSGIIKKYIEIFGELTIVVLLGVSSAMMPSVISAFYLVIFFGVIVYWSLNLRFNPLSYGILKLVVLSYLIFHMLLLYVCQLKFLQTWLDIPENVFYSRLIGMTPLVITNCSKPWSIEMEHHSWPYFANPIALFCTFVVISLDFAYHRSNTGDGLYFGRFVAFLVLPLGTTSIQSGEDLRSLGSSESSPFRREDRAGSSENQLLANEQQPSYDAVGSSPPLLTSGEASAEGAADIGADDNGEQVDVVDTPSVRKVWDTISNQMMRNSHLLAFFAMLFWAVGYPSWTAFVFLVLGCLLWLFPNSRRASLICSPLLVFYAIGLTGLQYICSINYGGIDYKNSTALFFNFSNNYMVSTIGLTGNDYPAAAILLKMFFTMCFCIVLKQLRRENCLRGNDGDELCLSPMTTRAYPHSPDDEERVGVNGNVDNLNLQLIGARIKLCFCKYWIGVFYLLLLLMAIQEPYIYRLVYMVLLLSSAFMLQLSYRLWRLTLKLFLFIVAIYSIIAIFVVYILSFHNVLINFQQVTGISTGWLTSLGFDPDINYQEEEGGTLQLLVRLIVPALLLITVMLQIHLFHSKFMELTDPHYVTSALYNEEQTASIVSTESKYKGFTGDIVKFYKRLRPRFHDIFYSVCRILTIHLFKVVYIVAAVVVTRDASAPGFVLIVIFNLSLFFGPVGNLRKGCLLVAQFWVGCIILARMLFQLPTMPKTLLMDNCTITVNHSVLPVNDSDLQGVQNSAPWLGLYALAPSESLSNYIGGYVGLLVALSFHAMFKIHDHYRSKVVQLPVGVTFSTIRWQNLGTSFLNFVGYLINFTFIRFGLEMCFVASAIVVCYRQDVIGAVYVFLTAILLLLNMVRRRLVRLVWFGYLVILALILPAQYLSALGLPETFCHEYVWPEWMSGNLRLWLFLPDYTKPPSIQVLIGDCIQLLLVALQWHVFRMEGTNNHPVIESAGDNKELGPAPPAHFRDMHDFIDKKRNVVDVLKSAVFSYFFWPCISILFITATQNINFYCFGYLVFCFYFFWHGLDFTIKDRKHVMRIWNGVLYYNMLVILVKTWLQILGCVYLQQLLSNADVATSAQNTKCYAPEIFSIKCLNTQYEGASEKDVCGVSDKEAGLVWDIVCFVMLLIQRRVFMSSYFLIVVCEERSQATLSSRGAELINILLSHRIAKEKRNRAKELAQIRAKLEKIRLRTSRLEGASRDDWTHFNDSASEVIRSADETMFEDGSDDETTTLADSSEITDPEFSFKDATPREKVNPMQMLAVAIDSGMESSIEQTKRKTDDPSTEAQGGETSRPSVDRSEYDDLDELEATRDAPGSPSPPPNDVETTAGDDRLKQVGEQAQKTDVWLKTFLIVCIKWIVNKLNYISQDYRTVSRQIDKEQVQVKKDHKEKMMSIDDGCNPALEVCATHIQLEQQEDEWQEELEKQSLFYRLFNALYLALISRTEFICYFAIILCQICNGNSLSLPLPIAAMLWGMLSLPRPAKKFWVVVLSYVMFVVVVKYIFQFSFWPWSSTAITKWNDPRLLIGISIAPPATCTESGADACLEDTKKLYYAKFELVILLAVFIHRSVLKRYGLWRNESEQEEDFNRAASSVEHQRGPILELSSSLTDNVDIDDPQTETAAAVDDNSGEQESRHPANKKRGSTITRWYKHIMEGSLFSKGDYYSLMVFCDFINFFISVFAYSSFGPQGGNVQDYIQENRIPVPFLIFLLIQFVLIIIDRALYLKKSVLGKLIFNVLLVIVVHVWMFFLLPLITNRSFTQNPAAQLFYFVKCLYFGLSAWQIKSGYPTGVLGNFLTTKYSYVNLVLFKGFMIIPFLLELRCVMDWMWTETSMSIMTWFTMEDIFSKVFQIKCYREGEKQYPTPRAKNRSALVKYGMGGVALVVLVFVIWFPLVLFSFANTISKVNPPIQCQMTVSISGFQDIFTVRSQPSGIVGISNSQLNDLKASYSKTSAAIGFLDNYDFTDVNTIRLNGESTAIWGITPPSLAELKKELQGNDSLSVSVKISFNRRPQKGLTADSISHLYSYDLEPNSETRAAIFNQISKANETHPVVLPDFLPRYMHLPTTGEPSAVSSLNCHPCTGQLLDLGLVPYHGLVLHLEKSDDVEYWSVGERSNCTATFEVNCNRKGTTTDTNQLFFVTFSDRVAPQTVSFITGPGIIGLYIGLVFVIGQFVRTITSGGAYTIMFDELPCVDKIMRLCKDLYFVRENKQLRLEEELYAKLVFLYRSPKLLIQVTKKKVS